MFYSISKPVRSNRFTSCCLALLPLMFCPAYAGDQKKQEDEKVEAVTQIEREAQKEKEKEKEKLQEADEEELEKMDSFSTKSEEGEEMICDPDEILNSEVKGGLELALYDCKKLSQKVVEPTNDERGRGEVEALKQEILEKQGKVDKSVVIVIKDDENIEEENAPTPYVVKAKTADKKLIPLKLYISLRGHLNNTSNEQDPFNDGTTRAGALYYHKYESGMEFYFHGEFGMQLLDEKENSQTRLETTSRLLYGSVGTDSLSLTYGKNWSVYYNVANVTDRFLVYGGQATGVYNAHTDGGPSGTGRADQAIQLRSARRQLEWGLQVQRNQKIPQISENTRFGWNTSFSGVYRWKSGITGGFAYNLARPEEVTTLMRAQGMVGDADARIVSANYRTKDSYIGVTMADTRNHETDDQRQYLDTKGWEVFYRYDLSRKWRLVAGHNRLRPASSNYAGEYDIKETVMGIQFTFGERDFNDMVFVEAAYNQGHLADGSPSDSQISVGFRYRFSY
ncbi:MAG: hypothetical protein ABGY96_06335 [bacterium]|nr:hypothetical protein [Gammaproteobacteria bacterium]HIL94779.1 hypothetical protein [Pseudomonadales bacterium]